MNKVFTVYEIDNGFLFVAHAVDHESSTNDNGDVANFAESPAEVLEEVERYLDCFYEEDNDEIPDAGITH